MNFRMAGHYVGDSQAYRSKEELASVREKCPIERLKNLLLTQGAGAAELEALGAQATHEVQQAVARARAAPHPDPAAVLDDVYLAPALHSIPG